MTWPNMALTKHGKEKTKFGLIWGRPNRRRRGEEEEEEKKKRREEERKAKKVWNYMEF